MTSDEQTSAPQPQAMTAKQLLTDIAVRSFADAIAQHTEEFGTDSVSGDLIVALVRQTVGAAIDAAITLSNRERAPQARLVTTSDNRPADVVLHPRDLQNRATRRASKR
jgi:TolB-like protein